MKTNVNVIVIFSPDKDRLLFCKRRKDPFKGRYNFVGGHIDLNFVGGHIDPGEDGFDAAYRELYEETGISRNDVTLKHGMDFLYYTDDLRLEIYYGHGEENDLEWLSPNENFFDTTRFAGLGNIGHILNIIRSAEQ